MSHGRTICRRCDAVIVSCRCPGPHVDNYDTCDTCKNAGTVDLSIRQAEGAFAEQVKRCAIVVQDGDLWLELPDGGMSVQLTKGKAWVDPDVPRAEQPARKHHVVMCRRHPEMPVSPVAVFADLDEAAAWVARVTKRQAIERESYGGHFATYYIESVETTP